MFVIRIKREQVELVKSDLLHHNRAGGHFKSSHLTEALAASLGFQTNAAMASDFGSDNKSQCVEVRPEKFWKRLSELCKLELGDLRLGLEFDLQQSICRAVKLRDFRNDAIISPDFENRLSDLFQRMAQHGGGRFLVEGGLYPNFGGSYRLRGGSLRPAFMKSKPSEYWQWSNAEWNNLLAMDWLEDHAGNVDLTALASESARLLEQDLKVGNVVFDAELGLVVQHQDIPGFTASILYQAPEQLTKIRDVDSKPRINLPVTAFD